jgi:TRAP-type C4-dicarboxylate transport system permease small subunit
MTALLANLPEAIGGIAMLAITLVLFAGVIWRYFFVDPLTWSDEISRLLFVWLAFIGAAVGVKRGSHSAVVVFEARMPRRWQRPMALFALAVMAVMAGVLVYTGIRETIANIAQAMPVTRISRGWQYVAVPISGGLMLIYLVALTRRAWRGELRPALHAPDGE